MAYVMIQEDDTLVESSQIPALVEHAALWSSLKYGYRLDARDKKALAQALQTHVKNELGTLTHGALDGFIDGWLALLNTIA